MNGFTRSDVYGGDGHFHLNWLVPTSPVYKDFARNAQFALDPEGKRWNGYKS